MFLSDSLLIFHVIYYYRFNFQPVTKLCAYVDAGVGGGGGVYADDYTCK